MLHFQICLSGHSRQTELMNGEAGRKSTLKVRTKPCLINRNTPFSNSVVTAQLNVLITINMSNYRHYLTTKKNWQQWQQSDKHGDNYKSKTLLTVLGTVNVTCKLGLHHHVTAWFWKKGLKMFGHYVP